MSKIVQIMPAEGWTAYFIDPAVGLMQSMRLVGWGLTEDGGVDPLVAKEGDAGDYCAADLPGFYGVSHSDDAPRALVAAAARGNDAAARRQDRTLPLFEGASEEDF